MTKKDDGGPAFPHQLSSAGYPLQGGMTLRDWFAGRVLTGIPHVGWPRSDREIAAWAYQIADAMIAARSKND